MHLRSWIATACHNIAGLSKLLEPSGTVRLRQTVSTNHVNHCLRRYCSTRQRLSAAIAPHVLNHCKQKPPASQWNRQQQQQESYQGQRSTQSGSGTPTQAATCMHTRAHTHTCNTYPFSVLVARRLSKAMLCCFCCSQRRPAPRYAPTKAPATQQHGLIIITTFKSVIADAVPNSAHASGTDKSHTRSSIQTIFQPSSANLTPQTPRSSEARAAVICQISH